MLLGDQGAEGAAVGGAGAGLQVVAENTGAE